MLILAQEERTTWVSEFDEDWLPPAVCKDIRVVRSGTRVGLEIGGVVGVVPLRNGGTLRIGSKIGALNFVKLMAVCEGAYPELQKEFDELAEYGNPEGDADLLWIIARSFARALVEVEHRSLAFTHKISIKRGDFAAGRIDPLNTMERLIQYSKDPIVFASHERNFDTPEHRVLGKAALLIQPLLGRDLPPSHTGAIAKWSKNFGSNFSLSDLETVDRLLVGRRLGGSRGYYARVLGLAKVILGQSGISSAYGTPLYGEGMLVRSASLFEKFVRRLLVDANQASGVMVTKGGGLRNQSLYVDGKFELEPDYVFQKDGKFLMIADAKYKSPDAKDHYQMLCYLMRYGVRAGVLFTPAMHIEREPIRRITPDGIVVWEVDVPLDDVAAAKVLVARALERFGVQ